MYPKTIGPGTVPMDLAIRVWKPSDRDRSWGSTDLSIQKYVLKIDFISQIQIREKFDFRITLNPTLSLA